MFEKRVRLAMLIFLAIVCSLFILVEFFWLEQQGGNQWMPMNDELADWLEFPDDLDPHEYKVDINRAAAEDLQRLPGIGPSKALAILTYRESLEDGFSAIDELLHVKGIGAKTLDNIRDQLTLDGKITAHWPADCQNQEGLQMRPLQAQAPLKQLPSELASKVCDLLQNTSEIVETSTFAPAFELRLSFAANNDQVKDVTLYCGQKWDQCRLGAIDQGLLFGFSFAESKMMQQILHDYEF